MPTRYPDNNAVFTHAAAFRIAQQVQGWDVAVHVTCCRHLGGTCRLFVAERASESGRSIIMLSSRISTSIISPKTHLDSTLIRLHFRAYVVLFSLGNLGGSS